MKQRGMKILAMLLTLAMVVGLMPGVGLTAYAASITVTWNASDIVPEKPRDKSFTKGGITFAPGSADFRDKNFINGGTFTTASGKFTKIEVTAPYVGISGTGWSGGTWTGDASSSVSYSGDIYDMKQGQLKIVFTIETADAYSVTLSGGANATTSGGATSQTGLTDAMTTVTYTANNNYQFPATSDLYKTTNGITVARISDTVVTVSGTPTANVNITVPDAAAIPTYTVTYKVINGTWSDDSTTDKTETVQSGSKPSSVPTGMKAASGYTGGAWDTNPAEATITGATTFTYTFTALPTYQVTYKVVNGTWSDDTTTDKTEPVASGAKPANVPTGMKPASGYTGGAWDKNPADTTITGATTFTYTFTALPTYTVTYRVVGGTWSDGTTADKTENVQSGLKPASVPTGMIASTGYTGGAWSPNPADTTITEATTFTYIFTTIPTFTVTYRVVGGTWADGTTADKTETVAAGAKPTSVPTGMIASTGYTGGAWSPNPAETTITEATIFTYIFTATPTFNVTVSETPNGTVTASKTTATAGENITLTITPASGYQIQATTVTDVSGNPVSVSNNSFTMPAANVIVTVTFIESPVQPTTYTVSFFANGGGGVMNPVTVPANTIYTLPACGFTPPAGKQFKAWQLGSTEFAPGNTIKVDSNAEFVALWKDDEGSGESGHGGITGDIVFIGGFNGGADEWYDGGYAPQRAWKVKLAPMVNGSAALGIMTGESTTTDMNVYPTTTIYVFPNANPGFVLDKIIWSYIDGTASYDITEAKNFVMPAMDVVVYVTFKPVG